MQNKKHTGTAFSMIFVKQLAIVILRTAISGRRICPRLPQVYIIIVYFFGNTKQILHFATLRSG